MKLADLLQAWVAAVPDCNILGLENDSRKVKPGDLFFAYPGAAADGRLFMQQAVDAGASAVVYEPTNLPPSFALPPHIPCLPLPGLDKKLAVIAAFFYQYAGDSLTITGITGTNGKTTIAYQLAQAYQLLGEKSAYIGTLGQGQVDALQLLNNTTPDALCLQSLLNQFKQKGLKHVCMEVSSHALSQNRVECINFTQAVYTNLSHEHLDYHQTMTAYADAKAKLFAKASLKTAIINQDDAYAHQMIAALPPTCQKITYGLKNTANVYATNIQYTMLGSDFEVISPWGNHHIQVKLLGAFNVYNSLAVFASLMARDEFSAVQVVPMMRRLNASPGRMEVVAQEPCVIVDYAHTPDALENVLIALKQLKKGRLCVVFGCGGDRDKGKRPMMGKIASQHADFVLVTSDNPRTENPENIIADIAKGLDASVQSLQIVDRKQAIQKALSISSKNDIILIAGKGHEAYQQIGKQRFVFSDQEVVSELLNKSS